MPAVCESQSATLNAALVVSAIVCGLSTLSQNHTAADKSSAFIDVCDGLLKLQAFNIYAIAATVPYYPGGSLYARNPPVQKEVS